MIGQIPLIALLDVLQELYNRCRMQSPVFKPDMFVSLVQQGRRSISHAPEDLDWTNNAETGLATGSLRPPDDNLASSWLSSGEVLHLGPLNLRWRAREIRQKIVARGVSIEWTLHAMIAFKTGWKVLLKVLDMFPS